MKLYKSLVIALLLLTTLAFPWGSELCQGCRLDSSALAGPIYTFPDSAMFQQMISTNGTFLFQDAIDRLPAYSSGIKLEIRTQSKSPLRLAYDVNNYVDFSVGTSGGLTINATGGVVISANGNVIIKNGNVGIGTTSPVGKLNVAGSLYVGDESGVALSRITAGGSGGDYGSIGYGYKNTTTTGVYNYLSSDYASRFYFDRGGFTFKTAPNGGTVGNPITFTDAMTILQNGNVGIGTTSPAYKLDVAGPVNASTLLVNGVVVNTLSYAGGNVSVGTLGILTTSGRSDDAFQVNADSAVSSGKRDFSMSSYQNTSYSPQFSIFKARGTYANPLIINASDEIGLISFRAFDGTDFYQTTKIDSFIDGSPGVGSLPTSLVFWTTPGGSTTSIQRMRINNAGNVGIGTASPAYRLDVAGDINSSTYVRAAGVALSSDKRFKKNIKTLDDSLNKVMQLRGVNYEWRINEFPARQFEEGDQIGVIAQEVEKIYPQLVKEGNDGFKAVAYDKFSGILIEAVKELKAQKDTDITALKVEKDSEIKALKAAYDAKLKTLEKEITEIKRLLAK